MAADTVVKPAAAYTVGHDTRQEDAHQGCGADGRARDRRVPTEGETFCAEPDLGVVTMPAVLSR
jgi:hypothetical protein